MNRRNVRVLFLTAVTAGFAVAAYWSARIAVADSWARKRTIAGTEKAISILPSRASFYLQLGLLTSLDDPTRSTKSLEHATSLNPFDANSWINLGLRAEADDNRPAAERALFRAAEVDKGLLPKWALANYYYRRGELGKFWFWAKASAAMAYGDPTALFRLCERVEDDSNLVDRLDLSNTQMRSRYLAYLIQQDRVKLLGRVAAELAGSGPRSDVPNLIASCDRLLDPANPADSLRIWDKLAAVHRIPFAPVSPDSSRDVITNGNFAVPLTGKGFDWRWDFADASAIKTRQESGSDGIRIEFTGRQPASLVAMHQLVPVRPGTKYQLETAYQTWDIPTGSGLTWRVTNAGNGRVLGMSASLSSAADQTVDKLQFVTPDRCRLVRLELTYDRALGMTRIEGAIALRNVSMTPEQ